MGPASPWMILVGQDGRSAMAQVGQAACRIPNGRRLQEARMIRVRHCR